MSDTKIKAYKAFDKNMQCRGYQFEVGKTYTHEGAVKACESGFHSCENPLDVLSYYNLCDARFAVVSASGNIAKHYEDSKIASGSITIEAELHLPQFIAAAVDWIKSACTYDGKKVDDGDSSQLAASGNYSKLAASGYSSQLAASGDYSKLAASGDYSKLAASGYSSQLAASGNYSQLAASGDSSIAVSSAPYCQAKAGKNGCIALTRWVESEKRYRVSVGYVGENIKADTWYKIDDQGNFVEVAQ